ncbi:cation transport protein-domain-containing protein [Lasiosphaeria ovina]|uniref:Potassium transport protein n=1 Tax=Lasiosphaeria ovina TaxID=92902 RepID=A0AAE0NEX6_9PEZI|nr:cation transport protein-domain-containing protein [Lasiosphaeria ovina]
MESFREIVVGQFKALRPSFLAKKPHFNFISTHYLWICGLAITGSIVLFFSGQHNLAYIDALFFASGASTQAGLNTVNVNRLNTFQQVVLYLMTMLANPITVNSFVVFLRLYWFEKRFQHIVREARQRRATLSKSRSKSKGDVIDPEKGVNGRRITVMHNGTRSRITNDGTLLENAATTGKAKDGPALDNSDEPSVEGQAEGDGNGEEHDDRRHSQIPKIKFSKMVTRSDGLGEDALKIPPSRPDEDHIAILERQRKGSDEVLRIPNPRDAERGMRPKRVEHGDDIDTELLSPQGAHFNLSAEGSPRSQVSDTRQQAITIEEPDRRKFEELGDDDGPVVEDARAVVGVLSSLKHHSWGRKKQATNNEGNVEAAASRNRRPSISTLRTAFSRDKTNETPYLSWEPTIGRNSQFPDLTVEQREELGGIEYRSLKTLALILTCYFWLFSAFGVACLVPWILNIDRWGHVVDDAAQGRTWWGFFTANSAFLDLGYTLTPDSMNSFNTAVFPLLLMSFLIVIGNTGFPVMLRFIIWSLSLIVPTGTGLYEEIRFLLDHPRRCFTLLFPSGATWWLFWLLVVLNGLDVIFFIVLDIGTQPLEGLPTGGLKLLNGLFEAASTRTAGFSCVNLAQLHPGVQVSYMIMMYISVFPIAISVRRTNVYEEKSLGIYNNNEFDEQQAGNNAFSYVGAHLRRQLSFDLWYIFVGFFILSISEGPRLIEGRTAGADDANSFSMFAVLFEIVSAYGTVGMSLGYPNGDESLCSQFSVVGKLVLIAMMIRGRHRGLPYGLDRAILLPSESLNQKEAADADARMARQYSHITGATDGRGASFRRTRTMSGDQRSNILISLLHPGPSHGGPSRLEPLTAASSRRSTDPAHEDATPYSAARSTSRVESDMASLRPRATNEAAQ